MDLVRDVLMAVADADGPVDLCQVDFPGHTSREACYHGEMMAAHGLLDMGAVQRAWGGDVQVCEVDGLTWDGQDYLDAIADCGVWKRTKDVVRKAVGSTTMAVVKEAAVMVATQAIRAQVGA